MPQCTLEFSANVSTPSDLTATFREIHHAMASFEGIQLDQIKSAFVKHEHFFQGDGDKRNAFVYFQIAMLSGRALSLRKEIGEKVLSILAKTLHPLNPELHLAITVEVREIDRETFFRVSR